MIEVLVAILPHLHCRQRLVDGQEINKDGLNETERRDASVDILGHSPARERGSLATFVLADGEPRTPTSLGT
jgi:hypothetical protein